MTASIVEPMILAVLVMILFVMVGVVVGGYLLWRTLRRRFLVFSARLAGGGVASVFGILSEGVGRRRRRPPTPREISAWSAMRARREMWRSVDVANSAVAVAEKAGGPVADLPAVCRRLHSLAADLDQVLRVEPAHLLGGPTAAPLRTQVAAVIDAATDVQRAAVDAASDAHGARIDALTRDARVEVDCLAEGLSRAGVTVSRPRR